MTCSVALNTPRRENKPPGAEKKDLDREMHRGDAFGRFVFGPFDACRLLFLGIMMHDMSVSLTER